MAHLTAAEILKYDSRQVVFYHKYLAQEAFDISFDGKSVDGKATISEFCISSSTTAKATLTKIPDTTDVALLNKLQTGGTRIHIKLAMGPTLQSKWDKFEGKTGIEKNNPDKLNIKRLYKSAEFKDGKTEYNRGDVAEGIQSAALVARFMKEKPNMTVTRNDVENVIKKLGKYKNVNEFTIDSFTSPNAPAGDGTQLDPDQIIYKVGLKSADMKAFLDTRVRYTKMDGLYTSAVNYANSSVVKDWDRVFYENGRRDIITVSAQGLEDQKGTKKDIDVSFTDFNGKDKKVSMEISVKAGGVGQFGQRGGNKFSTLKELMKEFYGVSLSQIERKYRQLINNKPGQPQKIGEALLLAYEQGYNKWGKGNVVKWDDEQKKRFAAAVKFHAQKEAGEVPQLMLLDSGKPTYKDYNLLESAIMEYDYFSIDDKNYYSDSGEAQVPRHVINMHEGPNTTALPILQIRVKVETEQKPEGKRIYFRSVIENQKETSRLVGVELDY